jgi:hypothetical protein
LTRMGRPLRCYRAVPLQRRTDQSSRFITRKDIRAPRAGPVTRLWERGAPRAGCSPPSLPPRRARQSTAGPIRSSAPRQALTNRDATAPLTVTAAGNSHVWGLNRRIPPRYSSRQQPRLGFEPQDTATFREGKTPPLGNQQARIPRSLSRVLAGGRPAGGQPRLPARQTKICAWRHCSRF